MKKNLILASLVVVICILSYWLYQLFAVPIEFDKTLAQREEVVASRLKEIRKAQRSFRIKNGRFTASFDELIEYIKNDSITIEVAFGSQDDSVAVAQGLVKRSKINIAVIDTLFPKNFNVEEIKFIPFSQRATGEKRTFIMDTASILTESAVTVPVFEAYAPYLTFLKDLNKQEVINHIDYRTNTLGKDAGLKVGSLIRPNNEAGNWE